MTEEVTAREFFEHTGREETARRLGEFDQEDSPVQWFTMADLQNPALLAPPPTVIPWLAWRGRVTLLAAAPKLGKSTLARHAVASKILGEPFLEEPTTAGVCGWLALDEALEDVGRGLHEHGVSTGILMARDRPNASDLFNFVDRECFGVLVIDTLGEFIAAQVLDGNDASQVLPALRTIRTIARETGCAIILIHHLNKTGSSPAGSYQFQAGVDVIAIMTEDPDVATRRRLKVRGRGVRQDLVLDWSEDAGYMLTAGGELSLDLRVLKAIEANPGIGTVELRRLVHGSNTGIERVLRGLLARGTIHDQGDTRAHRYVAVSAQPRLVP